MLISQLAKGIGAELHGKDAPFVGVSIDSRTLKAGELFVAIYGEQFDGHQFIRDAIAKGAVALMISQKECLKYSADLPVLYVKDTTKSLGQLGAFWREQFLIPVVGITGSCGKTSVKELTRSVLREAGEVLANAGTFNNHWGLPLTLLQLNASHQFAVLEMGANQLGEIEYLSKLAQPNVALITNVAPVHIEGFGSLEGVAKEKSQIYAHLKPGNVAILNADEPFSEAWRLALPNGVNVLTFGESKSAMVRAEHVSLVHGRAAFTLCYQEKSVVVQLNILGAHHVANALAAAAIGLALNLSLEQVRVGLQNYTGINGRMRKLPGKKGAHIIDDSYNANPTSVMAAIRFLAKCPGETMLILGAMAELGEKSPEFHMEIGKFAKQNGIQHFWAVDPDCEYAVKQFGQGGRFFEDKAQLIQDLENKVNPAMTILVKGSRRSKMETVVAALCEEQSERC